MALFIQVLSNGSVFKGPILPPNAEVIRENPLDDMLSVVLFIGEKEGDIIGSLVHFR